MDTSELTRQALEALCRTTFGGIEAVAETAGLSAENLTQVIKGYKLPSGNARGLGPLSRKKLDAAFPGWMSRLQQDLPNLSAGVAHPLSLQNFTIAPVLTWERLMKGDLPLVFKVAAPDNAMAPKAPLGAEIEFTRGIEPRPGDGVLVHAKDGRIYIRQYREGRASTWSAHALNDAYASLYSEIDGLTVIGVLTGIATRWAL